MYFYVLIGNYLGNIKENNQEIEPSPKVKKIIVLTCVNLKKLREQKGLCWKENSKIEPTSLIISFVPSGIAGLIAFHWTSQGC